MPGHRARQGWATHIPLPPHPDPLTPTPAAYLLDEALLERVENGLLVVLGVHSLVCGDLDALSPDYLLSPD
jgi:hypothetical protein